MCFALVFAALPALAAPYAAHVMDARTGETLYARNAETRLHPASLTKMLTLYIAFEAIERGEITLDTKITISAHAASQPPSRLGLKAGQRVALRYLIRAAAIKSANDAATAIGEGISGSEAKFAARMNRTAKALGMRSSTFKNANGLTAPGHLSTARDMSVLGRRLFYDFPQYYNIFSRRSADAGLAEVANTNRRFLDSYEGADGIKTGYTVAAGFNLTASAQRGQKRIIATVFGGTSTANRNAKMAELMDLGFGEAPARATIDPPDAPAYDAAPEEVPLADAGETAGGAGKTIRLVTTVTTSPRPRPRPSAGVDAVALAAAPAPGPAPDPAVPDEADAAAAMVLAMEDVIEGAVADAVAPEPFQVVEAETAPAEGEAEAVAAAVAEAVPVSSPEAPAADPAMVAADTPALRPAARPADLPETAVAETAPDPALPTADAPAPDTAVAAADPVPELPAAEVVPFQIVDAPQAGEALPFAMVDPADLPPEAVPPLPTQAGIAGFVTPTLRPEPAPEPEPEPEPETEVAILRPAPSPDAAPLALAEPEVVTRVSTSGGRHWGISLGEFAARGPADRVLMKIMLSESGTVGDGLRKVVQRKSGFEATVMGLSEDQANLACRRLRARAMDCTPVGP
jgi:D-alanyl-D-alanine carboxypeptidase